MLLNYQEFITSSKYEFIYDSEIKFELLENSELIDQIMDLNLESAIEYFKDNFTGVYIIRFEGGEFEVIL